MSFWRRASPINVGERSSGQRKCYHVAFIEAGRGSPSCQDCQHALDAEGSPIDVPPRWRLPSFYPRSPRS